MLGTSCDARLRVVSAVTNALSRLAAPRYSIAIEQGHSARMRAIEQLRYKVYIEEQSKALPYADHTSRALPCPDDDTALHVVATGVTDDLLGCCRLHICPPIPSSLRAVPGLARFVACYGKPFGYVSKLLVSRSLRGYGIAIKLMEAMVRYGQDTVKGEIAFFHCTPRLVPMYERLGLRRFAREYTDPHVGQQIPMYILPGDLRHFEAKGSPLTTVAKRCPISEAGKKAILALLEVESG